MKSQETADSQKCLHSAIMEHHGNKYHEKPEVKLKAH